MLGSLSERPKAWKDRTMMQSIIAVEPLPHTRLRITWADQSESVISLRPLVAKGGVFEVLTDRGPLRGGANRRAGAHADLA